MGDEVNIKSIPVIEGPPKGEAARTLLRQRLRSYRLDEFLGSLGTMFTTYSRAQLRSQLPKDEQNLWPGSINPQQIAFLAKAAILAGGNDFRSKTLSFDGYKELANLYVRLEEGLVEEEPTVGGMEAFLHRLSFQQFPWQMDDWSAIARGVLLFHSLPARLLNAEVDIRQAFEDVFGLAPLDFYCLGLLLWTELNDRYPARFFTLDDLHVVTSTAHGVRGAKALLDALVGDYQQFRDAYAATNPRPGFELYTFNPLERRPIVATQRSGLVCPAPLLLLRRLSSGLYYDLVERYNEPFLRTFGTVFEEYAGELLQGQYGADELFHEPAYRRGRQELRSTDWIVVEGRLGTLLECKTARLTLATKAYADQRALDPGDEGVRGPEDA